MKNGLAWIHNLWGKEKATLACNSWKQVFNTDTEEVRDVLVDLATYCNMYNSSFDPNNKEMTVFNEGARDVFLHIMEMLSLKLEDIYDYQARR